MADEEGRHLGPGQLQAFNQYKLAGYVASRKPSVRSQLRRLLYLR